MDLSGFATWAADQYAAFLPHTALVTRGIPTVSATATVRCRITEFQPHETGGGIIQGDRKGIFLTADLTAAGYPLPLIKGDRVTFRGKVMAVQSADDATASTDDQSIVINVHMRGA